MYSLLTGLLDNRFDQCGRRQGRFEDLHFAILISLLPPLRHHELLLEFELSVATNIADAHLCVFITGYVVTRLTAPVTDQVAALAAVMLPPEEHVELNIANLAVRSRHIRLPVLRSRGDKSTLDTHRAAVRLKVHCRLRQGFLNLVRI